VQAILEKRSSTYLLQNLRQPISRTDQVWPYGGWQENPAVTVLLIHVLDVVGPFGDKSLVKVLVLADHFHDVGASSRLQTIVCNLGDHSVTSGTPAGGPLSREAPGMNTRDTMSGTARCTGDMGYSSGNDDRRDVGIFRRDWLKCNGLNRLKAFSNATG